MGLEPTTLYFGSRCSEGARYWALVRALSRKVEGSLTGLGRAAYARRGRTPHPGMVLHATTIQSIHESSRHLTSYTRTGSSNPFATNSPRSANKKPLPLHSPRTVSATSISPPAAFAVMRNARITVAPKRCNGWQERAIQATRRYTRRPYTASTEGHGGPWRKALIHSALRVLPGCWSYQRQWHAATTAITRPRQSPTSS